MELINEILKLKKEKNAIILAHYYQNPEVQEIADAVGDSYYLSRIAKESSEERVIFCGVKFMAESAKILSPEKKIFLPALDAGCPMADMADYEKAVELRTTYPNGVVVSYINSSIEVKALSDVCVTSSNAVRILEKIKEKEIIFLPDKNLGEYLQEKMPHKKFILFDGYCPTHVKVKKEDILSIKNYVKDIKTLVHPECEKEIRDMADFIGSTGEIIDFATKNKWINYLVVTESGVLHELKRKNPEKNFYVPGKPMTCINMKKISLKDIYHSLLNSENEINIDENLRKKALNALEMMHKLAG